MQPKYYGAAANYHRPNGLNFGTLLKIAGLVVGVLALITIGYFVLSALTSGPRDDASRLLTRERNLYSFMANNRNNISDESLRTTVTNAMSLISSDLYGLQQGVRGMGVTTIPDAILKSETDTTSSQQLATASIQSRYDTVYWQILQDKIAAAEQLANQIAPQLSGTFKTAVQTNISNLKTIGTKLRTFHF